MTPERAAAVALFRRQLAELRRAERRCAACAGARKLHRAGQLVRPCCAVHRALRRALAEGPDPT